MPRKSASAKTSSVPPAQNTSQPLQGCTVVVTGKITRQESAEVKDALTEAGATIARDVTGKVTQLLVPQAQYVMCGKTGKAHDKGLPIVTFQWVWDCIDKKAKLPESDYPCSPMLSQAQAQADDDVTSNNTSASDRPTNPTKRNADTPDASEDEDTKPTPTKKQKKVSPAPVADAPSTSRVTTVTKRKGQSAPVDEHFNLAATHHVLCENGTVYDFMLNQTDISKNANKFYVAQVVESDNPTNPSYYVLLRWGRVGESGQSKPHYHAYRASAVDQFRKVFKSKSGVAWELRDTAPPKTGKYTYIPRAYESDAEDTDGGEDNDDEGTPDHDDNVAGPSTSSSPVKSKKKEKQSELDVSVQDLAQLIFSDKIMSQTLSEMQYDANKLPLGKLTRQTIEAGYSKLSEIDRLLDEPGVLYTDPRFTQLTSAYYTLIPHAFSRNTLPTIINNKALVKRESEIVDALRQMSESLKFTKKSNEKDGTSADTKHPLDAAVDKLGLDKIEPVGKDTQEYQTLRAYCLNTRGSTHAHFNYDVLEIFRVQRQGDEERFASHLDTKPDNRQLLWHGSRVSNFGGILGQGLRIAPPEAPVSGYMFGKGIYLANMSSKSVQYCNAGSSNGTGLLLLCEAQLGDSLPLLHSKYDADELAKKQGKHSVHGQGSMSPSEFGDAGKLLGRGDLEGVKIPQGSIANASDSMRSLMYDEHIVYSESQVRFRYLLRLKITSTHY